MTQEERVQSHREAVRRHSKKHGNIMIQPLLEDMPRIEAAAKAAGMRKRGFALAAVLEKLEQTPTPPRWIPVGERLPEPVKNCISAEVTVLACYYDAYTKAYEVSPLIYERTTIRGKPVERWRYMFDRLYTGPEILYWMPLPEPPTMEETEGTKDE